MAAVLNLVFGGDEYLVSARARELIRELVPPENEALGLETIDGNAGSVDEAIGAIRKCDEAVRTPGFFGTNKVVWFRDVSFISDNRTAKSETVKSAVNDLADLLSSGLPDGITLLVTAPAADKRFKFYKAFKNKGDIAEFAVSEKSWQSEKEARARAGEVLRNAGLRMAADAMDMFLGKVGTDTRQIVNEVEKLAIYLGERQDVTREDVETITCAARDALAWDLADAFGHRDLSKALNVLRQLIFQKQNPVGLIIAIEHRIRELLVYRQAMDEGWLSVRTGGYKTDVQWNRVPDEVETMFSEGFSRDPRKTHPYRAGLLAAQAGHFSMAQLVQCHRHIVQTHGKLVSSRIPGPLALELMLIRLLG